MLRRLSRLRGRSFGEIKFRSAQAVALRGERLRLCLGLGPVFVTTSSVTQRSRLGLVAQEPRAFALALARGDANAVDLLRGRAHQLRAGQVQLLGLAPMNVGATPNWHRDPMSGLIAPRKHWSQVPYLDAALVGDHKSLWEVNRHQYLLAPALMWLIDGEAEDFQLVQRHLSSWLDANAPTVGVNWASSLEVAYRAITWLWLLWLLQEASWDRTVLNRLHSALEYSGRHVERYLSVYFSPNTHLTGEALSLFYLGSLLPSSRHGERWRRKGAAILEDWLDRQVHADGVYTEQASLYQRYTAEIYLHYLQIARATGWPVAGKVTRALHGLFDVLRSMASASAELPLIGDDDGGQLLPLDQRSPEQIAGVLLAGATALSRPDWVPEGVCFPAVSYALCGVEQTDAMLKTAATGKEPRWRDRYFPQGGVAVLRDGWNAHSAVALIDAGPHGVLNCGHAHADALAMTLSLGAVPLFVDRGTLTYIGAERNEFRSTASHNTLEFDGESSVTPGRPFQWETVPARASGTMTVHGPVTVFKGLAHGHADSPRPSQHRRAVAHARGGAWLVVDVGSRRDLARATVRWQLAPGLTAKANEGVLTISDRAGARVAEWVSAGGKSLTQSVRQVSLRYGHQTPAVVLKIDTGPEARIISLIVPREVDQTARVRLRHEPQAAIAAWSDAQGCHELWVPTSPRVAFVAPGNITAVTQALWLTSATGGLADLFAPDRLIAIGAHSLQAEGIEHRVTSTPKSDPSDVVASRSGSRWNTLAGITPWASD